MLNGTSIEDIWWEGGVLFVCLMMVGLGCNCLRMLHGVADESSRVSKGEKLRRRLYICILIVLHTRLNSSRLWGKQQANDDHQVGAEGKPKSRGEEMAYGRPRKIVTCGEFMHVAVSQPTLNGHLANQKSEVRRSDGKSWPSIAIQNTDIRGRHGDRANGRACTEVWWWSTTLPITCAECPSGS